VPTKAREYVSVDGLGELQKCQGLLAAMTRLMRERFNSQREDRRATFCARVLLTVADVEEEALSVSEILRFSNGRFPVLWLNLTCDPERVTQAEIDFLEATYSLRLLGEIRSETHFR
jgi:hypothetical protein